MNSFSSTHLTPHPPAFALVLCCVNPLLATGTPLLSRVTFVEMPIRGTKLILNLSCGLQKEPLLDFRRPDTRNVKEYISFVYVTQFVVVCYGSSRKRSQWGTSRPCASQEDTRRGPDRLPGGLNVCISSSVSCCTKCPWSLCFRSLQCEIEFSLRAGLDSLESTPFITIKKSRVQAERSSTNRCEYSCFMQPSPSRLCPRLFCAIGQKKECNDSCFWFLVFFFFSEVTVQGVLLDHFTSLPCGGHIVLCCDRPSSRFLPLGLALCSCSPILLGLPRVA